MGGGGWYIGVGGSPRGHPRVNFKSQSESVRSWVVTLGGGMGIPDRRAKSAKCRGKKRFQGLTDRRFEAAEHKA